MRKVNIATAGTLADLLRLHRETTAALSAATDRHGDAMHPVVYALSREEKHLLREILTTPTASIEEARMKAAYFLEEVHEGAEVIQDNEWTAGLLKSLCGDPAQASGGEEASPAAFVQAFKAYKAGVDAHDPDAPDAREQLHAAIDLLFCAPGRRAPAIMSTDAALMALDEIIVLATGFDGIVDSLLLTVRDFIAATSPAVSKVDSHLLALGKRMEALWKAEQIVNVDGAVTDDEADAICGQTGAVVNEIIATPCKTLEGVRVKLRALLWCRDEPLRLDTTDVKVVASLFRDLDVSTAPTRRAA